MNVVCRLMCRDEIETAMRGEDVVKGDKGEKIYEHIVGNKLSFSPIKYCDMVSLGDITVILANMKNFFINHSLKEARKRGSKVYMVVFEDVGTIEYFPHMGSDYRTKYAESSKELLTSTYSLKDLKPLRMYEIDASPEMESDFRESMHFVTERATVDGYSVKFGFPVQVEFYEEAVNDMLHILFSEEEIRQIYDGFEKLEELEFYNEMDMDDTMDFGEISENVDDADGRIEENEDSEDFFTQMYREFYGRPSYRDEWYDYDDFEDAVWEFHEKENKIVAEQLMKGTVDKKTILSGSNNTRADLNSLAVKVNDGREAMLRGEEEKVK